MHRPIRFVLLVVCAASVVVNASADAASSDLSSILDRAAALEPWLVSTRRTLHQFPELYWQEVNTSAYIRRVLDELGISYKYPVARTGVVGTIGSGEPMVALRADMDALPIKEATGLEFTSRNEGVMHACGHDAHVTMLIGAAKMLKERESELQGTVRLVFQPAEEGGAGGDEMVKAGALQGAAAAFGMHVWPTIPSGVVATRPGTIMAGAIQFNMRIKGRGGHGAMPHLTHDPVVAASAIVGALQHLVSRVTSPFASSVVSVTRMQGGDAYNVIPDEARLGGTVRTTTNEDMTLLRKRVEEVAASTTAAYGCTGPWTAGSVGSMSRAASAATAAGMLAATMRR